MITRNILMQMKYKIHEVVIALNHDIHMMQFISPFFHEIASLWDIHTNGYLTDTWRFQTDTWQIKNTWFQNTWFQTYRHTYKIHGFKRILDGLCMSLYVRSPKWRLHKKDWKCLRIYYRGGMVLALNHHWALWL